MSTIHLDCFWARIPNEMRNEIMSYMNIMDLGNLAKVDPVSAHAHVRHRVRVVLARASLGCSELMELLKQTGSVVSGSAALVVFMPCAFENQGLDIMCPFDQLDRVVAFLELKDYDFFETVSVYHASKEETPDSQPFQSSFAITRSIASIHTMVHVPTGYMVSIVRSRWVSSVAPILGYHSTLLMNWISWDSIVSAYPLLTARRQGLLTCPPTNKRINARLKDALDKYRARGFDILDDCTSMESHDKEACRRGAPVEFKTPDVAMAFMAYDNVETEEYWTRWKLGHRHDPMVDKDDVCCQYNGAAWVEVDSGDWVKRYRSSTDFQ
ncbi:hypothetical protein BKA70DRAFT_1228150 [Coprinopsis sp. MPI-PUGE-AT-0042]|nr:hypothetical protein BKA70DRAFT_1228150 [Coprinopsis sp. MPI-PUGE-AT-0042]